MTNMMIRTVRNSYLFCGMIMMMIIRRIFNYNVRENTDNNDIHESDHFHDLDLQDNDRNDDHDGTHGKNTYYAK